MTSVYWDFLQHAMHSNTLTHDTIRLAKEKIHMDMHAPETPSQAECMHVAQIKYASFYGSTNKAATALDLPAT
jgi:hypothetical protein